MRIMCILAIICIAAALALLWIARIQNRTLSVTEYKLNPEGFPAEFDGFRIAQVSDYHGDDACEAQILQALDRAQPDAIVITGDLFDPGVEEISLAFTEKLTQYAPVYYVNGNHEAVMENYAELEDRLRDAGIAVLRNECVEMIRGDGTLRIAGADDPSMGTQPDYAALCSGEGYTVLLSHRPERFAEYVQAGADLVFCGHAHGGQFRLPGGSRGLIAPNQGLFPQYTQGVHYGGEGEGTAMVVSRGICNTRFPPRLFNPPELVLVTLRSGGETT